MECWYIKYKGQTISVDERCSWYRYSDAYNAFQCSDQWLEEKDRIIQEVRSSDPSKDQGGLEEEVTKRTNKLLKQYINDGTLQFKSFLSENYS